MEVFEEEQEVIETVSLFPEDRVVPDDAADAIQLLLSGLQLRNPRAFGNCWLGCEIWSQLGLDQFWQERFGEGRETIICFTT